MKKALYVDFLHEVFGAPSFVRGLYCPSDCPPEIWRRAGLAGHCMNVGLAWAVRAYETIHSATPQQFYLGSQEADQKKMIPGRSNNFAFCL